MKCMSWKAPFIWYTHTFLKMLPKMTLHLLKLLKNTRRLGFNFFFFNISISIKKSSYWCSRSRHSAFTKRWKSTLMEHETSVLIPVFKIIPTDTKHWLHIFLVALNQHTVCHEYYKIFDLCYLDPKVILYKGAWNA